MNKSIKISVMTGALIVASMVSCKDEFLTRPPRGVVSEVSLANNDGVQKVLVNTYRTLNGANVAAWYTSQWNWVWGSVRGGEAYKGSEPNDQNVLNPIERYEVLGNNGAVLSKWNACYDGIGMANYTIRLANSAADMSEEAKTQVIAQARFIRGIHHFEAKRNFNKVPYVDETRISSDQLRELTNEGDIYDEIEADLQFAYDNLPETQSEIGRVNKWAAGAFLAKVYLYQKKFTEAAGLFNTVITSGKTSSGEAYGLLPRFSDVFRGVNENSREVIFSVQNTVNDGANGANAMLEGELTNPHNDGPGGCCGFFQPSQSFANSFKTVNGLPDPNPHATDLAQHENSTGPYRGEVDPRLDHTVGRVGIQYLDWGVAKASWVRMLSNGGPFLPKKQIHTSAEIGSYQVAGSWGQPWSGRNILMMRFSDALLMAAEAEAETGDLAQALTYVNMVRTRAANPADFVKNGGVDEADYTISNYGAFADKAAALQAIKTERLLELGMEGHRYYDLARWGDAESELNAYLNREQDVRTHLADAEFDAVDLYLPIPEYVISQSGGSITPN